MMQSLNLKLLIMYEHQNKKLFLLKAILQIGPKNLLQLKKLKIQLHLLMSLMI